jgi:hypothetical protein
LLLRHRSFINPEGNHHALLAESSAVDDFDRHEMIETNFPDRALRSKSMLWY